MSEADSVIIAGSKTCGDWRAFRASLVPGGDRAQWESAFEDYFRARIHLRYLEPIRVLQENDTLRGEGFSIVAIHCTLIEFLESTIQGINYRYARTDADLDPFEYRLSGPVFCNFLSKREPFAKVFNGSLAQDFYSNVRCGLLHEARTKNGWLIRAKSPTGTIVDAGKRILFRDDFHDALLRFIDGYKASLISEPVFQEAFLRKFDSLCDC
jgi:hypothetical protein